MNLLEQVPHKNGQLLKKMDRTQSSTFPIEQYSKSVLPIHRVAVVIMFGPVDTKELVEEAGNKVVADERSVLAKTVTKVADTVDEVTFVEVTVAEVVELDVDDVEQSNLR
jgi:hypothetical protein